MERGTVSPKGKKWKREEIIALFQQGIPYDEIKKITGLPLKVLAGYKGYVHSPFFIGQPVPPEGNGEPGRAAPPATPDGNPPGTSPSEHNGHDKGAEVTQEDLPPLSAEVGPSEAQALASIIGKPYLINVKNVYVSPDALKCYQFLVAKGFKGSVGEFFELCVLKIFKERYGVVPGMISPPSEPPQ